ncbi:Hypothetical predicted protein [Pelobates cultripes]|uniref:Uncharacterized protein n=1 Tax=Pelobates cultripes TaxID=61616 RepID=A0AAD1SIJ1_PELCU|nr:Hypothetical predicted protein [Pelobates cultripes]
MQDSVASFPVVVNYQVHNAPRVALNFRFRHSKVQYDAAANAVASFPVFVNDNKVHSPRHSKVQYDAAANAVASFPVFVNDNKVHSPPPESIILQHILY